MKFLSGLKKLPGKTCLLRVDFNVESAEDALRLEASLPTMKFLLKKGARIVILSHRGRPEKSVRRQASGVRSYDAKLSLKFAVPFFKKNLGQKIEFFSDISKVSQRVGTVGLLENLRFWPEEEADDLEFAKKLAKLGDFYVNDAFAVSHRENASVIQLPKLLPSYAGMLLEKEIKTLSEVMKKPKKPLVLIFGGSKVEDKASVIKNLLPKADVVLLGSSAVKESGIMRQASGKMMMPIDWVGEGGGALDIGPETIKKYSKEIKKAKTIIWNGPVGKFEDKKYAHGSIELAKAVAKSKAFSIVGGGETTTLFIRAISNYQFLISKRKLFLSTGGGAMLEFLAGKKLPGIEALK